MSESARASLPRLVAITDLTLLAPDALVERLGRLARAAQPGSVALLLRDHASSAKARFALGQRLRDLAQDSRQQLWVADRLDLALLLGADAVHLGEGSVSPSTARSMVGSGIAISRAWHAPSLDGVPAAAELAEVDALLVSPLLAPRKGRPALGLPTLGVLGEQLRARNWACQIYALGGISAANAADCRSVGAHGVAAIGAALSDDAEPLLAALQILR
ncbi:MAG: thiamine phosphate synthase [Myxococcales bacterium]